MRAAGCTRQHAFGTVLKTVRQRRRKIAKHIAVQVRTGIKIGPKRIKHACVRCGPIHHGGHDTGVVLGFGQHAGDALFGHARLNFGDARRAGIGRVRDGNRPRCGEVERRFEILVGVMEDDEVAAPHRIENTIYLGTQRGQLLTPCRRICKIGTRIVRICGGKLSRDRVQPNSTVVRRQPRVRIMFAMIVAFVPGMVMVMV